MSSPALPSELACLAKAVTEGCTECRACQFRCAFLNEQGSPAHLARQVIEQHASPQSLAPAFHCALCGLCHAICPLGLPMAELFLAMRREAVRRDLVDLRPYRPLLTYERAGRSRFFADRIIPPGCDTVLFPGCTFPGTRPETLLALIRHLCASIPNLGVVLDCCTKPSHDLGRQDVFSAAFASLRDDLLQRGVRRVLTICPNCHDVFVRYGHGLEIQSVASALAKTPRPHERTVHAHGVQHIPCPLRGNEHEIGAIRTLARRSGLTLEPLKHKGRQSPCCGEGGALGRVRPDLSAAWGERCRVRVGTHPLLTSCAGCESYLHSRVTTIHVLDLYFFPRRTMAGRKPARGWRTYLNRLLLRIRLRRNMSSS
jgi:Fe-S oxidoreductase